MREQILNNFDLFPVLLALHIKLLGYTCFHRSQEFPKDVHKTLNGLSQVGTQQLYASVEYICIYIALSRLGSPMVFAIFEIEVL